MISIGARLEPRIDGDNSFRGKINEIYVTRAIIEYRLSFRNSRDFNLFSVYRASDDLWNSGARNRDTFFRVSSSFVRLVIANTPLPFSRVLAARGERTSSFFSLESKSIQRAEHREFIPRSGSKPISCESLRTHWETIFLSLPRPRTLSQTVLCRIVSEPRKRFLYRD